MIRKNVVTMKCLPLQHLSSQRWKTCNQMSRPLMTWSRGGQWQMGSCRITLVGVSRDLPTSQTTSIMISISIVSTMQNTFGTRDQPIRWGLFNATSKLFIYFVALGPQGGDSNSYQGMIQCFSGWGQVRIAILCRLLDILQYSWIAFLLWRVLNWVLMGILPWFRHLQQGRCVRLLVWWLLKKAINLQYNPCTMEATIVWLFSASQSLILSLQVQFKVLYTFICWHHSHIPCSGTCQTQLTWMLSISITCRLFDSMRAEFVAVISRHLIGVFSRCFNFCYGRCIRLCIIDVTRNWILKNMLDINAKVQKLSTSSKSWGPTCQKQVQSICIHD